jgi:hypothetical protein
MGVATNGADPPTDARDKQHLISLQQLTHCGMAEVPQPKRHCR